MAAQAINRIENGLRSAMMATQADCGHGEGAERRHRRPRDQQIAEDAEQSDKGRELLGGQTQGERRCERPDEEQGAGVAM